MAKLLKLRRGTTSQHSSFTGAEGEVTVDTDKESLVVHNGSQSGGFPLLRQDLSNLPAGTIDNADVNSSAAIAGTKISPNFGSQDISTTGDLTINTNVLHVDTTNNRIGIGGTSPTEIVEIFNSAAPMNTVTTPGDFDTLGRFRFGTKNVFGNRGPQATIDHDIQTNNYSTQQYSSAIGFSTMLNTGGSLTRKATIHHYGMNLTGTLDVTGETKTDKLTVEDDGSSGPLFLIKSDDNQPWALQIRNDTYSTGNNIGYKVYQNNNGDVDARISGDGAFPMYQHRVDDASTTKTIWETTTNSGFKAFYNNGQRLETTDDGATVHGTLTVNTDIHANRMLLTDDGSGSPTLSVSTDDQSPWAFQIKNDSYWNSTSNGFKAYQDNSGNFYSTVQGNGAFINHYFNTINGGTTNIAIQIDTNRAVQLYYQNDSKLVTTDTGLQIDGSGNYTQTIFRNGSNYNQGRIQGWRSGSGNDCEIGFAEHDSANWFIRCDKNNSSGVKSEYHWQSVYPASDNSYDLGKSTHRWRNIYTGDLHLSNKDSSNDVDGTWGDWTIQEGESDLFLKNNRSGKKYKFNLTEVS